VAENQLVRNEVSNSSSERSRLPVPKRCQTTLPGGFQCLLIVRAPYTAHG
jgi:hypothetical protein